MMNSNELYPLVFTPCYAERIWGGTLMKEQLHRELPEAAAPIGEAWEIVDRDDVQSVVANGPLAGKTLRELVSAYGQYLLGRAWNGGRFPLLVKLIDAGDRLSLQVHPDEAACARIGHGAEPKTEMWYIIAARRGAKIMAGLSPRGTRQQLVEKLNSPDVENLLQVYPSQPGDAYFITSGTLHAIGEGNLLLEVQQNSDTTYRVSDWGRMDADGKSRDLHVDLAMESIDFMNRTSPRIPGVVGEAGHNRKFPVVNRCRFFKVDSLHLVQPWRDDTVGQSFHLITAISNPVKVGRPDDALETSLELAPGQTALIPATYGSYVITPVQAGGETNVVRTTL